MVRTQSAVAMPLDFGEGPAKGPRAGLRLALAAGVLRGPDKYRLLDLKRRRAQIRARRLLGLVG
jgi:hypothetical protein